MPSRKNKKRTNALAEQVVQQDQTETGKSNRADNNAPMSKLARFFEAFQGGANNPETIPEPRSKTESELARQEEVSQTADVAATAPVPTTFSASSAAPSTAPVPEPKPTQSFLKYGFVYKLHLAASSKAVNFINWSSDGQLLQLSYMGLQDYLFSGQSIFRSRSIAQFVSQLLEVGFKRVQLDSEQGDSPQMYYQHKLFKPNQPEQLVGIATPQFELELELEQEQEQEQKKAVIDDVAKDPCAMFHGSCSMLQMERIRFQTLLSYQNGMRRLQEQEHKAKEQLPRRGRTGSNRQQAELLLTPALEAMCLHPQDSVSDIEVDHVPDYAGYYGNVNPSLIHAFFGEYLPHYGPRSTAGHSNIVVDVSKANAFHQNLPIGIPHSEEEDDHAPRNEETNNNDDDSQLPTDNSNPTPELELELEQMMDDLWGSGADSQPKAKRDKLEGNCAAAENQTVPDDLKAETATETEPGEDLVQTAAAADAAVAAAPVAAAATAADVKDDSGSNANANDNDTKKHLESQPKLKIATKRRRYDLRHSKTKRSN